MVFCGALLGLFAMHGLAGHDAQHLSAASTTHAVAVVGQHLPMADGVHVERSGPGDPAGGTTELLGLCLAVLGLAVAGLLALRARGVPVAHRDRTSREQAPAPPRRRDRDPPSLFELSIQRC